MIAPSLLAGGMIGMGLLVALRVAVQPPMPHLGRRLIELYEPPPGDGAEAVRARWRAWALKAMRFGGPDLATLRRDLAVCDLTMERHAVVKLGFAVGGAVVPLAVATVWAAAGITVPAAVLALAMMVAAVAGFVVPGIGSGEISCAADQQHVRFYPDDTGREQSMMLWTYKDWGGGIEKAIRESVHTQFSGPSFQEGLNKFSPPEKRSTGRYVGLITDRGVLEAPFGDGLAPATSIDLRWEWDFSDPARARCHVEAVLRTENGDPTEARPLARTLQVVWRGDANAPGRDRAATGVPGVGTVALTCERGPEGQRSLVVDPAERGGAVTTRQGSDEATVETDRGPLVAPLPNNGQVEIGLFGGATVLVSSRFKVNDPKPGENSCRVAVQVVVR